MQPLHFVANCISSTTVHQYFIFLIIVIFALIHHYNNEIIMKTELSTQLPSIILCGNSLMKTYILNCRNMNLPKTGLKLSILLWVQINP